MSRGPIEGVGQDADDEAPGVKQWQRYVAHQDEMAASDAAQQAAAEDAARAQAAEEEARQARAARAAQAGQPSPLQNAAAAAVGAAAATLRNILKETPEQRRMDVFTAMQAEALQRLEIAPHAEAVIGAQVASDNANPAAQLADREISESRRLDQEARNPELPAARKPDAVRPAPDWVAPSKKSERRNPDDPRGGDDKRKKK